MRRDELQQLIQGAICTLSAPFDSDYQVDLGLMYEYIQWLVGQGMATGNTVLKVAAAGGDGPMLTDEELFALTRTVVQAADGKAPVMMGISHKDTFQAIRQAKRAQDLGAVGLQVSPPIFNDPNQDDMLRHFGDLSDAIEIGIMIYHTPWFTHTMAKRYGGGHSSQGFIDVETFVKMKDFEHVVAIKWAVAEGVEHEEMAKFAHIFNVLDNNTDPIACHKLGGRGYIHTYNDVYPPHDLKIWELMESGQYDEAERLYNSIVKDPVIAAFSSRVSKRSGGMSRIKKARLEVMGWPFGAMRRPSLPLTDEQKDELREITRGWGWPVPEAQEKALVMA